MTGIHVVIQAAVCRLLLLTRKHDVKTGAFEDSRVEDKLAGVFKLDKRCECAAPQNKIYRAYKSRSDTNELLPTS